MGFQVEKRSPGQFFAAAVLWPWSCNDLGTHLSLLSEALSEERNRQCLLTFVFLGCHPSWEGCISVWSAGLERWGSRHAAGSCLLVPWLSPGTKTLHFPEARLVFTQHGDGCLVGLPRYLSEKLSVGWPNPHRCDLQKGNIFLRKPSLVPLSLSVPAAPSAGGGTARAGPNPLSSGARQQWAWPCRGERLRARLGCSPARAGWMSGASSTREHSQIFFFPVNLIFSPVFTSSFVSQPRVAAASQGRSLGAAVWNCDQVALGRRLKYCCWLPAEFCKIAQKWRFIFILRHYLT